MNSFGQMIMRPVAHVIASLLGTKPEEVQGQDNMAVEYYRNELLNKLMGRLKLTGIPDYWDEGFVLSTLLLHGYFAVLKTQELGVIPMNCSVSGQNWCYRPTMALFANPALSSVTERLIYNNVYKNPEAQKVVGDASRWCVLVSLTWNHKGLIEKLDRYAYLLAQCDAAMAVNLMNSKTTLIYAAGDTKEAAEYKKVNDQINSGKPAVFVNRNLLNGKNNAMFITTPAKQNFIGPDVMDLKRSIVNEFLTEIGVNNANTDKKERLNKDEVNANNGEISLNVNQWMKCVNDDFAIVKDLFGLDLKLELTEEDNEDVKDDNIDSSSDSDDNSVSTGKAGRVTD